MTTTLLLLATLSSCASGLPMMKKQKVYEVEEGSDATIVLHLPEAADPASADVFCIMMSEPIEVMFPEKEQSRFRGRVRRDEAAPDGRELKLRLSDAAPQDAGNFVCDVTAERRPQAGEGDALHSAEYFMLDVRPARLAPTPTLTPGVTPSPAPGPLQHPLHTTNTLTPGLIIFFFIFLLLIPGTLAVLERWYFRKQRGRKLVPIPCPLPSGTPCPCGRPHSSRLTSVRL